MLALGQGKYDIASADALASTADDTDGYVIVASYLGLVLGDQPLQFLLVSCHVDAYQARGDASSLREILPRYLERPLGLGLTPLLHQWTTEDSNL